MVREDMKDSLAESFLIRVKCPELCCLSLAQQLGRLACVTDMLQSGVLFTSEDWERALCDLRENTEDMSAHTQNTYKPSD